jgi:hypothetical protein
MPTPRCHCTHSIMLHRDWCGDYPCTVGNCACDTYIPEAVPVYVDPALEVTRRVSEVADA